MSRYILDTSAVRSASGIRLAEKAQSVGLMASPFCFWEMASHLRENFDRTKGNLLKFRYLTLLHEPTSLAEREFILPQSSFDEGPEDPDLIYAALSALTKSSSIEDFYECRILDSKDVVREIDDCVARINHMLKRG